MPRVRKYPLELVERGVRLALESGRPVAHVADELGIARETLRKVVRQAEADSGKRTTLVLDALHMALSIRGRVREVRLIHTLITFGPDRLAELIDRPR